MVRERLESATSPSVISNLLKFIIRSSSEIPSNSQIGTRFGTGVEVAAVNCTLAGGEAGTQHLHMSAIHAIRLR